MAVDQAELPSDIICYNILPRLPAKSLMRFKSVCKLWSSLIGSPSFAAANYQKNQKTTTNILFTYPCKSTRLFLSSQIDQQGNPSPVAQLPCITWDLDIHAQHIPNVQSINGLICASYGKGPVIVFNPTTRQSIKLPYRGDGWPSCHFGFEPISNEYKVLRVAMCDDDEFLLDIFTLNKDSSWRPLRVAVADLPCDPFILIFAWASTYLRGAIHWNWMCKERKIIVAFDVGDEKFKVIPLPDGFITRTPNSSIGIAEVEGCLVLYDWKMKYKDERALVLWIFKDDQKAWVKETVLLTYTEDLCCCGLYVGPLFTIHTGEVAMVVQPWCDCREVYTPPNLHLYDMKSKGYTTHEFEFPDWLPVSADTGVLLVVTGYNESIVPLVTNA